MKRLPRRWAKVVALQAPKLFVLGRGTVSGTAKRSLASGNTAASLLNLDEICFDLDWMSFHEAEAQHSGGLVYQIVEEISSAQDLNFD